MESVNPSIANAKTLPTDFYNDPARYAVQKEAVFARSWHWAADIEVVKVPGQVHPFTLLEGCLDEPLLLTRDTNDKLHCLSNVCTHRGNLVCEHAGNERALRCRYHGRRFTLDGKLQHMPEFEGVEGFPSGDDNLPSAAFGQWNRFLFASLNPSTTLEDWLAPVTERTKQINLSGLQFDASRSRDYLVQANWALYVENYLEGFHVPFVHPSLNEVLDYGTYNQELFDGGNVQIAYGDDFIEGLPSEGTKGIAALYFWMFPNLMLNFYPWGLSLNIVKPLSHDRTRISFLCYVSDASRLGSGAGGELDRVEREDEAIVETVQRGVRSRLYKHGRYSVKREQGVHQFHRMLEAAG